MLDFLKLFSLLNSSEKKRLILVIMFLFFSSIIQFLGITTIVVVIGLLADQAQILNNDIIIKIYTFFDFANEKVFINSIFIFSGIVLYEPLY